MLQGEDPKFMLDGGRQDDRDAITLREMRGTGDGHYRRVGGARTGVMAGGFLGRWGAKRQRVSQMGVMTGGTSGGTVL